VTGTVPVSLAAAVPSVAGWRLSGLPKGLEPGQLRILLGACDRRTPTGRRDYAIMLLLAWLGLRAGEVARLGLDDVDWRRGEIAVFGKGNRAERLPLPAEVGVAIAGICTYWYLSASPELMAVAGQRLDAHLAARPAAQSAGRP
jgi:integrase